MLLYFRFNLHLHIFQIPNFFFVLENSENSSNKYVLTDFIEDKTLQITSEENVIIFLLKLN